VTTRPVGILGGVFDPPHLGHCAVAQMALKQFSLSTVLFIPSGTPPHKKESVQASGEHRLAMLKLAVQNNPALTLYTREIHRPGNSYTIDTLHELKESYADRPLYFIVGSDNLAEIATWHRYREILSLVTLCVAHRPGYANDIPPDLADARVKCFPSPEWGLSSTMLRDYLHRGVDCRYLVPGPVLEYIFAHGLYQ